MAVKVFHLRKPGMRVDPIALIRSFRDEVRMSTRMRNSTHHVVHMFAFDIDATRLVGLVSMELGDDSLDERAKKLHALYARSGAVDRRGADFISAGDRKNIWLQLVSIIVELYRHNVVSVRTTIPPLFLRWGAVR